MVKKLIFIYNANSGVFSAIADSLHKSFSPKTYQCNLCALTYGAINMKDEWKNFINSLPIEITFLHRDEYKKKYDYKTSFPVILAENKGKLSIFLSTKELNKIKKLSELIRIIKNKI